MINVSILWNHGTEELWEEALRHYWDVVPSHAQDLEELLDRGVAERVESFNEQDWFGFLYCEYFPWKYTAKNRLATTRQHLLRHVENGKIQGLDEIRTALLAVDHEQPEASLATAKRIHGLGTAGASGLLALMYPEHYGTVDQFIVKALQRVEDLEQSDAIETMNPEDLSVADGALLIRILRAKAESNNQRFGTSHWTPRKIDQVLWSVGRGSPSAADCS